MQKYDRGNLGKSSILEIFILILRFDKVSNVKIGEEITWILTSFNLSLGDLHIHPPIDLLDFWYAGAVCVHWIWIYFKNFQKFEMRIVLYTKYNTRSISGFTKYFNCRWLIRKVSGTSWIYFLLMGFHVRKHSAKILVPQSLTLRPLSRANFLWFSMKSNRST